MFAVIGTTTADLFIGGVAHMPSFDGDEFTTSSLAFCSQPLTMTIGGNGANSAYVLRSLGAPTALLSATGTNEIGQMVTGWLTAKGVDLSGFIQREDGTATTTTVLDGQLSRISFYYPGIFPTFGDADIPDVVWEGIHTLLITGVPLLPGFRDGGFYRTLQAAREYDITTALDIGPAIGQPAALNELCPLLPLVDYLIANAYELSVATGTDDVEAGAQALLEAGAACVIVKQGQAGARYLTKIESGTIHGFPVKASVTVGAGDAFNASLLFALHEGQLPGEAIRFANAAAALVVQSGKSALGAPSKTQVDAFLRERRQA